MRRRDGGKVVKYNDLDFLILAVLESTVLL